MTTTKITQQDTKPGSPCVHGATNYKRCRTCQDILAHREAVAFARRQEARTKDARPRPAPPSGPPARPETIAAARAAAAQAVERARQAEAERKEALRSHLRAGLTPEQYKARQALLRDVARKLRQAGAGR